MKIKKSFFLKIHSNFIHYKCYKNNKIVKNEYTNNKLLENVNYYTKKEKKNILKQIYENITLKKNHLKEELLKFYMNDKDIKQILEQEKIYNESSKIFKINQIESNEEILINKFNNFYDLLHFSIENLKRKDFSFNKSGYKLNDFLNSPNNILEKHEFIINNLDIIKKYILFIEKNLNTYNNTSYSFKIYFSLNKFIVYFFNYSFPYINFFDYKLLYKYTLLFIKLNLLENYEILNQKKNKSENIYSVNISNEDIFYLTKNNVKNSLQLLILLSNQVSYYNLPDISEFFFLFLKKTKVNELIKNVNDYNLNSIKNEKEDTINGNIYKKQLPEENNLSAFESTHMEVVCKGNNNINDLHDYSYIVCLYFNSLFLLNKIISNNILFSSNINKNISHLFDCIAILCENIFDETFSERKIMNLNFFLINNHVKKYIIKDIIFNHLMTHRIEKNHYSCNTSDNYLINSNTHEDDFIKKSVNYLSNNNILENNNNEHINNFIMNNKNDNIFVSNNTEIKNVKKKNIKSDKKHNSNDNLKFFNDFTFNNKENGDDNEISLLKQKSFYEECFLNLYKNTGYNVKLFFKNMCHYFILYDCDNILKFLQVIYVTKYTDLYNINVLFYSIWLNSDFLKNYQIKNVLFFLSLFKSNFIIKNIDLQNTIYNCYNKQLIFYLRKKLEIYFENNSLENSIKSIFTLCDLISYNKVIKKIMLKKLVLLNFNHIHPTMFCQIFFLLNKLRFNSSNKLFSELFLKHYKKVINFLTHTEILDLIKNMEYLINKKKRKIFLVMILHFFRKLKANNYMYTPCYFNYISKLINIINKFKLYEYCRKEYFYPIYHFIFSSNEEKTAFNKEKKYYLSNSNNICNYNNYTFLIKDNKTVLLEMNAKEKKNIYISSIIKNENSTIPNTNNENEKNSKNIKIKLELLTINQILDLIFFIINTNTNIYIISELYTDIYFRILRNVTVSKKQLILIFRSIWLSRIFHLNLFNVLIDIISCNQKLVDNSIFSLDILLCLCSYKHKQNYEQLIISLFHICFDDIDKILNNVKKQILFYYCFLFLEIYYPLLFLKVSNKIKNNFFHDEIQNKELSDKGNININQNLIKKNNFENNKGRIKHRKNYDNNTIHIRIDKNLKKIERNENTLENIENTSYYEIKDGTTNSNNEMNYLDASYKINILNYLRQFFFLQQKKNAYSYDLFHFSEVLNSLNVTKLKFNNVDNIFFKNYELNNLFVLNIYFPFMKFCILFTKDKNISKNSRNYRMNNFIMNDSSVLIKKKEFSEYKMEENSYKETKLNNGDMKEFNFSFDYNYRSDINILVQKLYLYKNYKINVIEIPIEKIKIFFKINNNEKQNSIINESNFLFEQVYQQILKNKKDNCVDLNILSSLLIKQLQFIFQLN
ncbi:conserved protein, unknown function [Plasmodium gallinaceum]|uniref:Uncharacterized protein n=1 Tax=Plasmodium gallinaceum TaxID=5849 RepID=A0A1J1GPX6_PLAGA|nr:conserved protein, unknown function [Plasmodium gallinaceum]CRG94567.1 conserved protein, unknown function [Plasmodium gallinaceum]